MCSLIRAFACHQCPFFENHMVVLINDSIIRSLGQVVISIARLTISLIANLLSLKVLTSSIAITFLAKMAAFLQVLLNF